ncbi:hypothetical protein [Terracoccus luteus]|uniref:Uncharacterized protein n=1 Tax=Terracoccus luteus TaxID=53356 RepID=A0A839Q0H4_9MICO|nr:hypothetical protein [Terracoccus luteus]MBB2988464.1 hypothetical protein [Terracoccus luteus]MCP2174081.1 hypothetical protein [Terracoccus luteus]
MGWFTRNRRPQDAPPATPTAPVSDPGESPDALRRRVAELNGFVNANAGRLPAAAVVSARHLTDTLREIIDTSDIRPLDVYAAMAVTGTLGDYLPTTLRSYLAIDADLRETPRGSGRTPTQSLLEQIDDLQTSASATLVAARNQDADALMTQGNFLRTKFSRSDLDL